MRLTTKKRIFDHTWPYSSLAVLRPNYVSPKFGACNFAPQFFGGAGMRRSNFEENLSNLRAHLIFTGQCRPQFPRVAKLRPPNFEDTPHNFRAAISHPQKNWGAKLRPFSYLGRPPPPPAQTKNLFLPQKKTRFVFSGALTNGRFTPLVFTSLCYARRLPAFVFASRADGGRKQS